MSLPVDIKDREYQKFIEAGLNNPAIKAFYPPLALKIPEVGAVMYIAKAPCGTAQASPLWQAFKIDETAGLIITWADSNALFDNVATDLTLLTYG